MKKEPSPIVEEPHPLKKASVFGQKATNVSVFKSSGNSGGSLLNKNFSFPRLKLAAPKISEAASSTSGGGALSPNNTPKKGS